MGVTAAGRTVRSATIENDGSEIMSRASSFSVDPGTLAFASLGTSPSGTLSGGLLRFVAGSGSPSTGTITIPHRMGKTPSRVFLDQRGSAAGWRVSSVTSTNIVLTATTAPTASSVHNLELIVE